MCDAAFQAALGNGNEVETLAVTDAAGAMEWPGFAYFDGQKYAFGREAEYQWFLHPRLVVHTFLARLAH